MTGNEKLVSAFMETLRGGRTIAAGTFALAMLLPTGAFAMDSKHGEWTSGPKCCNQPPLNKFPVTIGDIEKSTKFVKLSARHRMRQRQHPARSTEHDRQFFNYTPSGCITVR